MKKSILILILLAPATLLAGVTNAIGAYGSFIELLLWGLMGVGVVVAWLFYSSKKMKEINKKKENK